MKKEIKSRLELQAERYRTSTMKDRKKVDEMAYWLIFQTTPLPNKRMEYVEYYHQMRR